MGNKPVHIVASQAQGKLYGRRAVWAAVRELQVFTKLELRLRVPHVSKNIVAEYLTALNRGGFVAPGPMVKGMSVGSNKVRQYQLVRDSGVDAPRLRADGTVLAPTAQQNMWLALKIVGAVTPAQLARDASSDETPVPEETACAYLRHLLAAGYVQTSTGDGEAYYRLINDTGGYAPMVQRTKCVFDPNLNKIMWHEEIEQ